LVIIKVLPDQFKFISNSQVTVHVFLIAVRQTRPSFNRHAKMRRRVMHTRSDRRTVITRAGAHHEDKRIVITRA
jgi:hypothetical protein